ncbi:pentatricopeptide repeat-containing protein [Iris pallida]|uniref:Pentatricopeptide repeat-containing protein n=1 Tax=Iris pallida TaxID=29817 RepID=A0AAX6DNM1_IRIPA|nr:pentatricopeptide repeat-containing protein [Iris pallida]
MDSAKALFDEMPHRDVVAHSVLISGCALSGDPESAVRVFRSIGSSDVDGLAMVGVLQACAAAAAAGGSVGLGRMVHSHVVRRGFEADLFVGNSVVDMYSKCRDVDSAVRAFGLMPGTNVVSWNSMLSGLVRSEMYSEALELFGSMSEVGVEGDEVTVVNLLQASKKLGMGVWCKCIHSFAIRRSFETNEFVLNSLLDAYAKCDLLGLASRLFERLDRRDVISWSTMIAGFAHCGKPDEAVAFFLDMRLANETPNSVTVLGLLEACTVSAELKLSKGVHGLAIRNGFADELAVGTALVDVYAKCGDLASSTRVFGAMPERNVMSWNAMIGGLGMNGRTREAVDVLREMEVRNVKPNGVTMLSVLSACSHGGLVEEGLSCFRRMKEDPLLQPGLEHYCCVVDMLGRAGELESAVGVIEGMPEGLEAGKAAWSALLSACRSHGDVELGQVAASRVLELEPTNSAGYLLASSMYAKGGLREEMASVRRSMRESRPRLESGCSVVHVQERAHKFYSWDGSHPHCEEIYDTVERIHDTMYRTL